ncbi:AMP-binding protein [Microlunatus capsulatus]|uniref:Acetyl-CoA synthetase n=1 Tax=Microlunatus capsulatus TaxID=99117 RepID=A0ABS4ZD23_9ACTN|nr:AMP-binding protein [Microlunatus capsulatus]MBP2418937.1 acetyl-CoA synthetase [Microlunatus capsulatus]
MPSLNRHLRAARDFLVKHRDDYEVAHAGFSWPELPLFNFATDWFDGLAEENPDGVALWVVDGAQETRLTFRELADRSVAVAQYLHHLGLRRGDRLLVVLGNVVPLWEVMLGAIRLGAVVIPATPQLSAGDLADRVGRGDARMLVADAADVDKFADLDLPLGRLVIGGDTVPEGWLDYRRVEDFLHADRHLPGVSKGDDPVLLYFTSGTTALPKLVEHSQTSYPVGHLSTLYWMGLQPGDVHLNISSPGWGKHAWSNFFTPWLAGATVLVHTYTRFDPDVLLEVLVRCGVTTFCAPPTVWRMLVQTDLAASRTALREVLSAGEPLNPEVIDRVRDAWGLTIRDGYGQTETTAQVGNPPGARVKTGSMGRPLPGYDVVLVDPASGEVSATEGELCLRLDPRPVALMKGYKATADTFDDALNTESFAGGVYHTGDVVSRDEDGYLTYVGRADDVFKSSDYKISPFELESVLIEHPAVAEAAVVAAPDPIRLAVPKAYVILAAGHAPDAETARSILAHARSHLAPYRRVRRLEFGELPKTISGKIRRVELREAEEARDGRAPGEFRDSDFEW